MSAMIDLKQYINLYPVNKTMRFKLIPTNITKNNLAQYWDEFKDEERFENYPIVKELIDSFHKTYIKDKLSIISHEGKINFNILYSKLEKYNKAESIQKKELKKEVDECCGEVRKEIAAYFPKTEWESMLGEALFKKDGYIKNCDLSEEDKKILNTFNGFATFLDKYGETRANVYKSDETSTAIAFRIVNVNFPKFVNNINAFKNIKELYPKAIEEAKKSYPILNELFEVDHYIFSIEQGQIEEYNREIGELNKQVNLCKQQIKNDKKMLRKNTNLIPLYNQIMGNSEKKKISFLFENEDELLDTIDNFVDSMSQDTIVQSLDALCEPDNYNLDHIYTKKLEDIAVVSGLKWNALYQVIYDDTNKKNKSFEDEIEKIRGTRFSLSEIKALVKKYNLSYKENAEVAVSIDCIFGKINELLIENKSAKIEYIDYRKNKEKDQKLDVPKIKKLLDSYLDILHWSKMFEYEELSSEYEEKFYGNLASVNYVLGDIVGIYNKSRNFVTKKVGEERKMILKFNRPEFCKGFASSKLDSYGSFIVREGKKYSLIVVNKNYKFAMPKSAEIGNIEIMFYSQFSDVKKMIPKCIWTKEVKSHFEKSKEDLIINNDNFSKEFLITYADYEVYTKLYNGKKKFQIDYLKQTNDEKGYNQAVKQWIDLCMRFLKSYKSTMNYDYSSIEPLKQFTRVDLFYNTLDKMLYKVEFVKSDKSSLEELEKEGKIFVFEIYNKDFSKYSKGTKNLHTLYFEQLFSDENKANPVFQLNGGAELFYRRAQIEKPIVHKTGSIIVNKTYMENGKRKTLPDKVFIEWYNFLNGRTSSVSDEAKKYENKIVSREAWMDIVKDKKYTREQYEFHIPFTINYHYEGSTKINSSVLDALYVAEKYNVIGIDRGERNLLAYTVVNQNGKILKQGTFNNIVNGEHEEYGVDYKRLLQYKENDRKAARKDWDSISNIKNLKTGYLSQVIHKLTQLMVEYNAVIALENLNGGFKRGRMKVERQIYQNFEKALIDKLNYLVVTKDEDKVSEAGGVCKGYQLSEAFETFDKLGSQNGFMFYVPAGYTSKIDPISGFVDVFNFGKYTNAENRKSFFEHFKNIGYDKNLDLFYFDFDYDDFPTFQNMYKKDWRIYTVGDKYVWNKELKCQEKINVTDKMKKALARGGIVTYDKVYEAIVNVPGDKTNAEFWSELFYSFRLAIQLRSSQVDSLSVENCEDKIISPIMKDDGTFYESTGDYNDISAPADADTNGAYNIAQKGLLVIEKLKNTKPDKNGKWNYKDLKITNEDWFKYLQKE